MTHALHEQRGHLDHGGQRHNALCVQQLNMRHPLQPYADRCFHRGIAQHITPQLLMRNDILIGERLLVVRRAMLPYYDDTAGQGWVLNHGIVKMTAVPPDQYSSRPETWATAFIDTLSSATNQGLTGITSHCNIDLHGTNASSLLFLPSLKADLVLLCALLEVSDLTSTPLPVLFLGWNHRTFVTEG